MERRLEALRKEKEAAVASQEFEKAASLRDDERKLGEEIEAGRREWHKARNQEEPVVDAEQIAEIVSEWTGIPVVQLTEEEAARLMRMEEEIHRRMVDQTEAVNAVSRAIRRSRSGLKDPKRPAGASFPGSHRRREDGAGPFARGVPLRKRGGHGQVRHERVHGAPRSGQTIGAPPGYVGYEEWASSPRPFGRPYSVVLFDEIEKAHPDIFNILLQILEDGRLTDGQGHTVDFRNSVVIMTSNIGARDAMKGQKPRFRGPDRGETPDWDRVRAGIVESVKKTFRPEFLNRVDEMIVFEPLGREELLKVLDLMVP